MIHSLNVAQTGMAASKASVENVMNNVANANTEGYKKRVVETSELSIADNRLWGRGVSLDDTVRITSQYLYDNILKEGSKESYQDELSFMLDNVESIFEETDESGLSADLDRYFQSVESLRANPENEVYKNELKLNAQQLVDDLKRLYDDMDSQEILAKNSLETSVSDMNQILKDIASVNDKINDQGFASNDLLDKRDLLEKKLSEYVNISVDRDNEFYELKVGGDVLVRNNNARTLSVEEEFTAQKDRFTDDNQNSSILDGVTFDNDDKIVYELNNTSSVSVEYGESMTFDLDGDGVDDAVTVDETNYVRALVHKINTSSEMSAHVQAFNGNYSLDENGNKVTDDNNGDQFLLLEAKIAGTDGEFDSRVTFVESEYTTVTTSDNGTTSSDLINSITPTSLDDGTEITYAVDFVAQGTDTTMKASFTDDTGGYFTLEPTFTNGVTYDSELGEITIPAGVTDFEVTMNTNELAGPGVNQNYTFEIIDESNPPDETLQSIITINDTAAGTAKNIFRTEEQSEIATDKVFIQNLDEEVVVLDGKLKANIENLTTESGNNKFDSYKNALDDFVKTFVDMTASYIKNEDGSYVYGEVATDANPEIADDIGLFSGSSVKTLEFNDLEVGNLTQKDYDYLATMQWKDDISFNGFGQTASNKASDTELRSFSQFYQDLRINISRDKENSDFLLDTQKAVNESLNTSYDKMTKVDTDEEMVNLIKFQAAYTANAKIITVVDEMLNTVLGIKR